MRVPPSAGATCDTSSTEGCLAATTLVRANHAVQGSRGSNRRTMQNHQPWRFPCGAAPARGRVLLCIPPSAGATCDTPSTEGCLATDSRNSDTLCEPQTWLGRGRAAPPGQAELVHITHIASLCSVLCTGSLGVSLVSPRWLCIRCILLCLTFLAPLLISLCLPCAVCGALRGCGGAPTPSLLYILLWSLGVVQLYE